MIHRSSACSALMILVGLASRRYGLSIGEMMQEAKISRRAVFWNLQALERMGVQITRHKEPVRASWRTLYRLAAIRGLRFDIKRVV